MASWRSALTECALSSGSGLQFVAVFDGLWPVPHEFVPIARGEDRIRYVAALVPERGEIAVSKIFVGTLTDYQKNWAADVASMGEVAQSRGRVKLTRGRFSRDADQTYHPDVAVFVGDHEYVILWGMVAREADTFLACFERASREYDRLVESR